MGIPEGLVRLAERTGPGEVIIHAQDVKKNRHNGL